MKGIVQFHQDFQSTSELFEYGILLFEQQNACRAISGILMGSARSTDPLHEGRSATL